jgi:hypothetical protein
MAPDLHREAIRVLGRWSAVIVFLGFALYVTVDPPYRNSPAIRSDGLGYQAWTEAILNGQLSFCSYRQLVALRAVSPPQPGTGRCADKYPPGLALLRFAFMAPFTAAADGRLTSPAEDAVDEACSVAAGALVVGAILVGSRRLGARPWIANAAALSIAFGTGVFHYATYDSSFTMIYSAALVSLLMLFGIVRVLTRPELQPARAGLMHPGSFSGTEVAWDAAFLFVVTGTLVAVRLPSVLVVVGLAAAGAATVWRQPELRRRWSSVAAISVGPALLIVLSWQLFYDKYTLGHWTLSSYAAEHFHPTEFQELPVLGGFLHGFLTWYPVAAVALVAAAIARRWRALLLLVGLTLPLVALYGSWHSWSLGGGFGHRGFVEIMPVFGVVLACSVEALHARGRTLMLGLAAAGTVMCLGLMAA